MNRKTQNKQANAANRISRTTLVAAAVGVMVVGVVAATFLYDSGSTGSVQAETTARQAALASEHSPTVGDSGAKVHIVEFLDPACETCALFYPMVKQWMAEVPGEIRLSVRHIAFHTGADYAVRALEASRNQDKYWQTLEALLASQRQWTQNHMVLPDKILPAIADVGLDMEQLMVDMNAVDVMQRIEQDKNDAILLKISATPEYFVNGRPLPSFGRQQLADLIREELSK
ncbi:MAG: thioredoxin domain-containing protein [Gammaproteobacteria bacterium]|nr:thioredoxin domain-containing protein [Gammaproteobacteria bacterium]